METSVCQRWRNGRASWRPAGELFDPRAFEVAEIPDDTTAEAYVVPAHYSHSYPNALRRFGLYARRGPLVGCVVFSEPMVDAVLRPWRRGDAMELGRLVLDDEVPGNAESWFVRRCLDAVAGDVAGVVSYSDPEPRADAAGRVVFCGHVGTVYQALNAVYTERTGPKTLRLFGDATEFSNRAASKIRAFARGDAKCGRGWRYAVKQLVGHGAREPEPGENLHAWMRAELARLTRTQRHRGNHRYAWALTPGARRDLRRDTPRSLEYPKFNSRACQIAGAA